MTIPDRYLAQILIVLEHRAAYLKATKRDGRPFEEIIEELRRKASPEQEAMSAGKSRRHGKRRHPR